MKKESRVHTFYLRHSDISTSANLAAVSNNVGGWSAYKQTTYWNIDIKQILGNDWNKYDTFRIHLRQYSYAYADCFSNILNDGLMISFLSGLNFKTSSYNYVTKNHSNKALFSSNWLGNTFNASFPRLISLPNYFSKGDASVKFQIEHFRVTDGLPVPCSAVNGLPQSVFCFEIQGIE